MFFNKWTNFGILLVAFLLFWDNFIGGTREIKFAPEDVTQKSLNKSVTLLLNDNTGELNDYGWCINNGPITSNQESARAYTLPVNSLMKRNINLAFITTPVH